MDSFLKYKCTAVDNEWCQVMRGNDLAQFRGVVNFTIITCYKIQVRTVQVVGQCVGK